MKFAKNALTAHSSLRRYCCRFRKDIIVYESLTSCRDITHKNGVAGVPRLLTTPLSAGRLNPLQPCNGKTYRVRKYFRATIHFI